MALSQKYIDEMMRRYLRGFVSDERCEEFLADLHRRAGESKEVPSYPSELDPGEYERWDRFKEIFTPWLALARLHSSPRARLSLDGTRLIMQTKPLAIKFCLIHLKTTVSIAIMDLIAEMSVGMHGRIKLDVDVYRAREYYLAWGSFHGFI